MGHTRRPHLHSPGEAVYRQEIISMKHILAALLCASAVGCNNAAKPLAQSANNAPVPTNTERSQTAIAHSSENQTPKPPAASGDKSKWTQSGDPVDTTEVDSAIMLAEKAWSAKPADATAKKSLSAAYLKRAMLLTEKRQYASALGDYRRALKYDEANTEAKEWIDRIIAIYASINRDYPKEGEEPPALPFTKSK